jgi:ABC-type glycerol-3-phosphate transport system substrate-binding protein
MKNFQTILLIVFGVFIAIGMAAFSGFISIGKSPDPAETLAGDVTIWGTLPGGFFKSYFEPLQQEYDGLSLMYEAKNPETYHDELVQALAAGVGPDIFLMDHDRVVEHKNKVLTIPYESYSQDTFRSQFVDQGGLYLSPEGIVAVPFLGDPLVLFYNRDLLNSSFILEPPKYWDELLTMAPKLTQKSETGQITRSAIALGTVNNIEHSKDILATLSMQGEVPFVIQNSDGTFSDALFGNNPNGSIASALRFYTSFADPNQEHYSWNVGLRDSQSAFIAEELVMYIGYASEMQTIRQQNPNLNFDVTILPQTRDARLQLSTSRMTAFAISKQSQNVPTAYNLIMMLTDPFYNANMTRSLLLPSVRREVLNSPDLVEPYMQTFYNSMIISRGWWDPKPEVTKTIFDRMITDTLSGLKRADETVREAQSNFKRLLDN